MVHARGAGAFGEFVTDTDFSDVTVAHFLGQADDYAVIQENQEMIKLLEQ